MMSADGDAERRRGGTRSRRGPIPPIRPDGGCVYTDTSVELKASDSRKNKSLGHKTQTEREQMIKMFDSRNKTDCSLKAAC